MIRATVRMTFPRSNLRYNRAQATASIATHLLNQSSYTERLTKSTLAWREQSGPETANQTWEHRKTERIVNAAEETQGAPGRSSQTGWKKQPDWFLESSDKLKPTIEAKNKARVRRLHSNTEANRKKFRSHQRLVKKAVNTAKEEWVAKAAKTTFQRGGISWESIKKFQGASAGRKPSRSQTILKENVELVTSIEETRDRWQQHF